MRHHTYASRSGGQPHAQPDADDAADWFAGRLPDGWFGGDPTVIVDREEITVIGRLPDATETGATDDTGEPESPAHLSGRVARFREDTRGERMRIADQAQHRYGRTVSWGVDAGDRRILFTHLAVPVMTRLKQPERRVLDTLVDAGVARSRSDALAWSVKLVGEHADEWLARLREAMTHVEDLRAEGPGL